jgi:hypothetical protein
MRLPGAANFRPVSSLRPILFRSDHLGALDAADIAQIRAGTLPARRSREPGAAPSTPVAAPLATGGETP